MVEKAKRIESVKLNRINNRWCAKNDAYTMIRGYGISSLNAVSRLRHTIKEKAKLRKGISP